MTREDGPRPGVLHDVLEGVSDEVKAYTKQASTVSRSLALAGVGLVWLYADTGNGANKLQMAASSLSGQWWMLVALVAFLVALVADIAQYMYGAHRWQRYEEMAGLISEYDDFKDEFPSPAIQDAWSSWAGRDLADHITHSASIYLHGICYLQKPTSQEENIIRARRILATVYRPESGKIEKITSKNSEATLSELMALQRHLDRSWSPRRISTSIGRLYWSKLALTAAGYVSLLIGIILVVF